MYKNDKVASLKNRMQPKRHIMSKNDSNKSWFGFNLVQISQQAHMSISPWMEAIGLQRLSSLKYNMQKGEKRFALGLNTAKNTHYVKNFFK